MELLFVGRADDDAAMRALGILGKAGHATRVLEPGEIPELTNVAVFGSPVTFRNSFLRLAKHRMGEEGIMIPDWATPLPFVVAVQEDAARITPREFRLALAHLAHQLTTWEPWMSDAEAPWRPDWHRNEAHAGFPAWREDAARILPMSSAGKRLATRLTQVFEPTDREAIARVVVTGCALFNGPHTDVTDHIPERTQRAVTGMLGMLFSEIGAAADFIVPGPDLLDPRLRDHFHPFMFMAVDDVERALGVEKIWKPRLLGPDHAHARTDDEIAAALTASADALVEKIVRPSAARSGQSISARSWTDIVGPYLSDAHRIAHDSRATAAEIYGRRVATRPSYKSLHAIDPERGLARTIANNVLYIAEALYLYEHPDVAIVNCEHEDTFWRGLEGLLAEKVWGSWRPLVGMVPQRARQPWGY